MVTAALERVVDASAHVAMERKVTRLPVHRTAACCQDSNSHHILDWRLALQQGKLYSAISV